MLHRVIIFGGLGLLAAACAPSKGPAVPSATIQTTAVVAATEPKSTTVPSSSSTTTTTTTAASSTIPETPVAKDPDFDAIEQLVTAGEAEYSRQNYAGIPDRTLLSKYFEPKLVDELVNRFTKRAKTGIGFRPGSIEDVVVVRVKPTEVPELKLVTVCTRNNSAEYRLGNLDDPSDDVFVQDNLGIDATERYVLKKNGQWRLVSGYYQLSDNTCDSVFP